MPFLPHNQQRQSTEGNIPDDWKSSVVLPIYKGKGDPMEVDHTEGSNCWNML